MQMEDMILVSIDDHVIEPRDMFDRHMPAKYRDDAPKYVHDAATGHRPVGVPGSRDRLGRPRRGGVVAARGVGLRPGRIRPRCAPAATTSTYASATWTPTACWRRCASRTFAGFNGMSLARSTVDRDLTNVVVSAYNDWHIDELGR